MDPAEYERMHALESSYWWFVGRRVLVGRLLDEVRPPLRGARRIVDVGCGTGANLPLLRERLGVGSEVVGFDFSPLALAFARDQLPVTRRVHSSGGERAQVLLCQGDALRMPLASDCADLVTMLDVLEHLSDDRAALAEVRRVLRPGGALVLSVPAYQHLWSAHDEALHHFRRYEKAGLFALLRESGFRVDRLSFAMSMMPPVAWAWRRLVLPLRPRRPRDATRHSQGAVLPRVPGWFNRLLIEYLRWEGHLIAQRPLRFGTSLVALAYAPGTVSPSSSASSPNAVEDFSQSPNSDRVLSVAL